MNRDGMCLRRSTNSASTYGASIPAVSQTTIPGKEKKRGDVGCVNKGEGRKFGGPT